jgi:ATP-binding cassette, subfamily B, heavy metal transporter
MLRDLTALSTTTAAGMALDRRAVGWLLGLVWPGDDPAIRRRLVLTVGLLVGAAGLNALVPLLFARAVDRFVAAPDAVLAVPVGLRLAYVLLGWGGEADERALGALRADLAAVAAAAGASVAGAPA